MGKLQVGIFFPYKIPIAPTLRLPDFTSTKAARIKLWISLPCCIALQLHGSLVLPTLIYMLRTKPGKKFLQNKPFVKGRTNTTVHYKGN